VLSVNARAMPADYRDIALADAALDYVLAQERIAGLEADVEIYRLLGRAALDALSAVTLKYERLQQQHDRLQDAYRCVREDVLLREDETP
jgi:hypothetical protein